MAGRPLVFWLIDNLALTGEDHLWLAVPSAAEARHGVAAAVRREYPWLAASGRLHVVLLRFVTRGAAETLFIASQAMAPRDLRRRTVSLDSDTVYFADVLERFRRLPCDAGACCCFFQPSGAAEGKLSFLQFADDIVGGMASGDPSSAAPENPTVPPLDASRLSGAVAASEAISSALAGLDTVRRAESPLSGAAGEEGLKVKKVAPAAASPQSPVALSVVSPRLLEVRATRTHPSPRHLPSPAAPQSPVRQGGDDSPSEAAAAVAAVAAARPIARVAERQPISNWANCGAYGFATGAKLRRFCREVIDSAEEAADDGTLGAPAANPCCTAPYFLSAAVQRAIDSGERFVGINLGEPDRAFVRLDCPTAAEDFAAAVAREGPSVYPCRPMRFSFDLDGALLAPPAVAPAADAAAEETMPRESAVAALRALKAHGHTIIVRSTRGAAQTGGGYGAVSADGAASALRALARHGIPCDELLLGQPRVDAHVGCCMIDPTAGGLAAALGIAPSREEREERAGVGVAAGAVRARHFNEVAVVGDTVVKRSTQRRLEGELFYFRNLPLDVSDLFPRLLAAEEGTGPSARSTLTLERVEGITYSHLLTNRCVTRERLARLAGALKRLHASEGQAAVGTRKLPASARAAIGAETSTASDLPLESVDAYANYALKVEARFEQFAAVYDALPGGGVAVAEAFDEIMRHLEAYEAEGRADVRRCIHGDPVFSNALLTADSRIQLIDMHGALGGALTTAGDCAYDLAKVLQSLCGYDYVLLDAPLEARDVELLDQLKADFAAHVAAEYPDVRWRDVEMLTASLYFSLLPLHDNAAHRVRFWRICQAMLYARTALRDALVSRAGSALAA